MPFPKVVNLNKAIVNVAFKRNPLSYAAHKHMALNMFAKQMLLAELFWVYLPDSHNLRSVK